jgi:hypothetical protein
MHVIETRGFPPPATLFIAHMHYRTVATSGKHVCDEMLLPYLVFEGLALMP